MPQTLPEWLWFAFFTIGSAGGWVLRYKGRPVTRQQNAWDAVVVAAGLGHYRKEPDGTERLHTDVTPHVLKHTGTTWLLRDGVDLWDVSGLTSTSTKTLEGVYGHHSPDYQKASAKAFRRRKA